MNIDYEHPERPFIWWETQRIRYDIGLIIAGIAAFVCYCIVFEVFQAKLIANVPDPTTVEISLFTILIQSFLYGIYFVMANFLYFLGFLTEMFLKPSDPSKFRKVTYNLGFWVSFAVPFLASVDLIIAAII